MAAALPFVFAGISAGASIYGGYSANQSAKKEASAMEAQGQLLQEEADAEARAHAKDVRRFAANQSLAFLANGVSLAGSPLLVTQDTVEQGQAEVDSIVKAGNAKAKLYNTQAQIRRNEGRASFIAGLGQAAGTLATTSMSSTKKTGGKSV